MILMVLTELLPWALMEQGRKMLIRNLPINKYLKPLKTPLEKREEDIFTV
jgi:hypothetical protein